MQRDESHKSLPAIKSQRRVGVSEIRHVLNNLEGSMRISDMQLTQNDFVNQGTLDHYIKSVFNSPRKEGSRNRDINSSTETNLKNI